MVALLILIGFGLILGWNRQLIATVHELRMARAIRTSDNDYHEMDPEL